MPRARQYGFLRLDSRGDDYSDLYVPVEILQWFENDSEVEIRTAEGEKVTVDAVHVEHALQDHFQGCEDLLTLRDFSEPALLHTLRVRFSRLQSYTAVGTILVSVNPYSYHNYEETYGEHVMELYRGASSKQIMASTSLPPHLFTVAERATRHAYHQIEDEAGSEKPKDQAIIISGESGAGKTEATKLVVQYLAWRSRSTHDKQERRKQQHTSGGGMMDPMGRAGAGSSSSAPKIVPVEERIVATTPLLEALGNARTLRNDNSSRFGKFMRLFMADDGTLMGCKIEQYLLEVTRVVKQAEGENNFHILFQLLSAKDEAGGGQKPKGNDSSGQSSFARKQTNSNKSGAFASLLNDEKLKEQLDLRQSSHFHYLARGGAIPVKGMTDSDGWATTLDCLQALNLEPQEVAAYVRLLAAVLHLGNLTINNPATDWPKSEEEKKEMAAAESAGKEAGGGTGGRKKKFSLKEVIKMGVQKKREEEGDTKEWGTAIQHAKNRNNFQGAVRCALNERAIKQTASLVHIDHNALEDVIRHRRIVVGADQTVTAVRAPADAHAVRDAICKALYSRLWQSVIRSLNQYLDVSNEKAGVEAMGLHFIGLLDFAGFEHFFEHSNGFEQLLINYANEMLQWHFNCFIFEVEIAEYAHEGIDTTEIQFRDNEPCVHLIDNPGGIISKLDDTCLQGDKGELNNDLHREKRFIRHLFDAYGNARSDLGEMQDSKPFYFKPRHDSDFCFGIKHYAGDVVYDTRDQWANKNVDALHNDAQTLLEEQPGNPYIRRILKTGAVTASPASAFSPNVSSGEESPAAIGAPRSPERPGRKSMINRKRSQLVQRSVSRRFADSLKSLIGALTACYPQFVRCIKPNHHKSPEIFAGFLTFRQLVNSGMIEAINARQAGYAVRIPHAEFLYKFACLIKRARWATDSSTSTGGSTPMNSPKPLVSAGGKKLLTSQLAMMEDDPLAAAELKKRSLAFVAELTEAMHEVINKKSTQVGNTKVFMKATFAYTLHRIAEITEDHWVRKLQRVVRKYLSQGAALREAARRRYRALLEAANAALAASRKTRPRRRANLAAETSITGFKRRLDNLSLGPAADIYSTKLETILNTVNKKLDTMAAQCKRIKQIESGEIKVDVAQATRFGFSNSTLGMPGGGGGGGGGGNAIGSPTREEMDAPQVLYKFTRAVERQIGEAESLSRALGDALEERRQFQSRVWEIYERFMVNEESAEVKLGIKPIMDQVINDAEAALGTKFDEIELDGLDGDRMLEKRIAVLIAHKELTGFERDMLGRRRAVKQKLDEEEGYKARLETLDTQYRAVLEQVELFMELCQAVSVSTKATGGPDSGPNSVGTPSAELMVHMQRVHQSVETAETALESVMQQAEQREEQQQRSLSQQQDMHRRFGASASPSYMMSLSERMGHGGGGSGGVQDQDYGESESERYCKERIADAAEVVLREMNGVEKLGVKLENCRLDAGDQDEAEELRRASDSDLPQRTPQQQHQNHQPPQNLNPVTPDSAQSRGSSSWASSSLSSTPSSSAPNSNSLSHSRYTPPQHRSERRKESAATAAAALQSSSGSGKMNRRRSKDRLPLSTSATIESPLTAEVLAGAQDNEDGLVVMASLDISKLSAEAQAKSLSPGFNKKSSSSNPAAFAKKSAKSSSSSSSGAQTKLERKRQMQQQQQQQRSHTEGAAPSVADGKLSSSSSSGGGGGSSRNNHDRRERRAQRHKERAIEKERQQRQQIAAAFGVEVPEERPGGRGGGERGGGGGGIRPSSSSSGAVPSVGSRKEEFLSQSNAFTAKRQSGGGKRGGSIVYKTPFEYGLPTSSNNAKGGGGGGGGSGGSSSGGGQLPMQHRASIAAPRHRSVTEQQQQQQQPPPVPSAVESAPSKWKRPSFIGTDRRSTVRSEDNSASSWIKRSPSGGSPYSTTLGPTAEEEDTSAKWKRPSFIGTERRASTLSGSSEMNSPRSSMGDGNLAEPGSPDGLSPTSIYRTASFRDRALTQEMRRRKLDEIQEAREKAERERDDKEAEKGEKYTKAAAAKKAEEMAKAQFHAERRGAPKIAPEMLTHMVEDETGYRSVKTGGPSMDSVGDGDADDFLPPPASASASASSAAPSAPPSGSVVVGGDRDLSISAAASKGLLSRLQRSSVVSHNSSIGSMGSLKNGHVENVLMPEVAQQREIEGEETAEPYMRPGTPDDLPPPSDEEDDEEDYEEESHEYVEGEEEW